MSTALEPVADDDEFGDASFLDNFDVDAAVAAARAPTMEEKPAKRAKVSPDNHNRNNDCLEDSLQHHFGFSHFRPGQKEAIQAILDGQDVAIFWATGAGKSICYQLPALLSNRVTVVISPLISLMQDQVHKLNGLSEHNLATYLGSAQADPVEETRALQGKYSLIYVTPEKLVSSAGFLDRLANLDLALIAVDESHCIR
jgi:ATP-dependent DNA helicase RecQ/Werner syndrome ATP-dependent helicase